jgi:hypothetical protein
MLIAISLNSCAPTDTKVPEKVEAMLTKDVTTQELEYLLPSPADVLEMVYDLGLTFSVNHVAPLRNPHDFILYRNQALNFGVYLTDFSGLLLFEKYAESLKYLTQIQGMAIQIGAEKYFDDYFFNSILTNLNKSDTLKTLAVEQSALFINKMESIGNKDLVLLISTGAMVEVLYISSNIFNERHINNNTLTAIANFDLLFDTFYLNYLQSRPDDPGLQVLTSNLQDIRNALKSMNIIRTSNPVLENGNVVISSKISHEVTSLKLSVLKKLIAKTRNKLINQEL